MNLTNGDARSIALNLLATGIFVLLGYMAKRGVAAARIGIRRSSLADAEMRLALLRALRNEPEQWTHLLLRSLLKMAVLLANMVFIGVIGLLDILPNPTQHPLMPMFILMAEGLCIGIAFAESRSADLSAIAALYPDTEEERLVQRIAALTK